MWENRKNKFKMMRVRWFYRTRDTVLSVKGRKKPIAPLENEVFISDKLDDNYLTTIETVCNIPHYNDLKDVDAFIASSSDTDFFFRYKYIPEKSSFVAVDSSTET
jgi:hypothetical protein